MDEWYSLWPVSALAALSILIVIVALPAFLQVVPSAVGCVFRVRECQNLAHSVSQSRSRDYAAAAIFLPMVMAVAHYAVYPPLAGANPYVRILLSLALFVSYGLLKGVLSVVFRSSSMSSGSWKCALAIPRTFFLLMGVLAFPTVGVLEFLDLPPELTASVVRWEMAVSYALCLLRQLQIFIQYRGFFMGFLYLCALEIFPTGILIVSAVFL